MATISFQTKFDLTLTPKQIIFTDTSGLPGQGVALADVVGDFTVTAPSGAVIWNNTDLTNVGCDIDLVSSLVSQQVVTLPLGSDGFPESGNYVIVYRVWDSNLSVFYTTTHSVNYQYKSPKVCILQPINCIAPLFSSVDATDYTVNGIFPTISGTHTLFYPVGSDGYSHPTVLAFTAEASVIAVSLFYQNTQTTEISATLTYPFVTGVNGFSVVDAIDGEREQDVDCAYICSILCCIQVFYNTKESFRDTNSVKFKELNDIYTEIMSDVSQLQLAINCGQGDQVCLLLKKIRLLSKCTDSCKCTSGTPSRVIGLGYLIGPAGPAGDQGVIGATGNNGNYVTVTVEAPGVNCVAGGQRISLWNGITNGIISVNYICNGEVGTGTAVRAFTAYGTPFVISKTTLNQNVTGATGTATLAGTYMIIYEADLAVDSVDDCILLMRLNKTGGVAINNDSELTLQGAFDKRQKLVFTAVATLTAGQTVVLNVDSVLVYSLADATIYSRSITMLKLA